MSSVLTITHNAGFFSCCSVRLDRIIAYVNCNKKLPMTIDSSQQFDWYKTDKQDITYDYFVKDANNDITVTGIINYNHHQQFDNYKALDYAGICPFVRKYFTLSDSIRSIVSSMEVKYNISSYDDICVLFYRGNDKSRETKLPSYDAFIQKAEEIRGKHPAVKFLIQSDETEFIETISAHLPTSSFYFKDEIRHMKKQNNTVDRVFKSTTYEFSKYYLAITMIMSKCKYVVCGTGNCSIWIMLFREHANGLYQIRDDVWL